MVETIKVMSVADLYVQYARFARHYDLVDNPLTGLTRIVPKRALYCAIAPLGEDESTKALMERLAGRRKLRRVIVHKDEIKHPAFSPVAQVVVYYA